MSRINFWVGHWKSFITAGPDRYIFQYRKGNLDGIKRDMGEFGAKFLSEDPFKWSVNANWDIFKENIVNSWKKNIPQKKVSSRWNLLWITPEIKRLCRKKKRGWDAGKRNRNSHAWKRYQKLSKLVKESLENAHRTYVDIILNTIINEDPKCFFLHNQKKSGQSNIPALKTNGKLVS